MMPQISGFDVLQALDKDPDTKGIRVFVMTAKHLTPQESSYLEKRVEMVVQKGSRELSEIIGLLKTKLTAIREVAV